MLYLASHERRSYVPMMVGRRNHRDVVHSHSVRGYAILIALPRDKSHKSDWAMGSVGPASDVIDTGQVRAGRQSANFPCLAAQVLPRLSQHLPHTLSPPTTTTAHPPRQAAVRPRRTPPEPIASGAGHVVRRAFVVVRAETPSPATRAVRPVLCMRGAGAAPQGQ